LAWAHHSSVPDGQRTAAAPSRVRRDKNHGPFGERKFNIPNRHWHCALFHKAVALRLAIEAAVAV
jgi:hypothetical protein